MSHIKLKEFDWKGEYIGDVIIHRPYHKPYNRKEQKKQQEKLIEEQLSELEQECCEVIDVKDRNMQEIRLIVEYANYTKRDIQHTEQRNTTIMIFHKLGYSHAFAELYKPGKVVTLDEVMGFYDNKPV